MSQKHTHWCSECYCEWLHDDSTCAAQRVLACPPCEEGAAGPEWVDDLRQVDDVDFIGPEPAAWAPKRDQASEPESSIGDAIVATFAKLAGGVFKVIGCLIGLALAAVAVTFIVGLSVHALLVILVIGLLLLLLGSR